MFNQQIAQADNGLLGFPAGKYIFSGARFRRPGPVLVFDTLSNQPSRLEIAVIGVPFTLRRFKRRLCIGRYDLATSVHHPCPTRAPVDEKETHCPDCQRAIGFAPAFYNLTLDQLSSQQRRYNDTPHVVYLAWFAPSVIKVGISSSERRIDRWLEQGVIGATVIFHTANAYEARKLEEMVSSEFKYREVVRSNEKLRGLFPAPDHRVCATELAVARWEIAKLCSIKVQEEEIFDGRPHYLADSFPAREPVDLSNERPLVVSGFGHGIIGDILLIIQRDDFYCVRLKTILAHVVELSAEILPNVGGLTQRRLL